MRWLRLVFLATDDADWRGFFWWWVLRAEAGAMLGLRRFFLTG
jgi:hypothetical protein